MAREKSLAFSLKFIQMKQVTMSTSEYYNVFLPLAKQHDEQFHVKSIGTKLVLVTMSEVFADAFDY